MKKHLYLLGGTMGVGKTTVCRCLNRELEKSVYLDGDWCWNADPFVVTGETKAMVMDNICHVLNNFLHCTAYENVVFCWVLHEQAILDELLSRLDVENCRVHAVSLVCRPEELRRRLQRDVDAGLRTPDVIDRSLPRLPLYDSLRTVRLDVSDLSAGETARAIERLGLAGSSC